MSFDWRLKLILKAGPIPKAIAKEILSFLPETYTRLLWEVDGELLWELRIDIPRRKARTVFLSDVARQSLTDDAVNAFTSAVRNREDEIDPDGLMGYSSFSILRNYKNDLEEARNWLNKYLSNNGPPESDSPWYQPPSNLIEKGYDLLGILHTRLYSTRWDLILGRGLGNLLTGSIALVRSRVLPDSELFLRVTAREDDGFKFACPYLKDYRCGLLDLYTEEQLRWRLDL